MRYTKEEILTMMRNRTLILDGATGTYLQQLGLSEEDFRGSIFRTHPTPLKGCNDVLCLTQPEKVKAMHLNYLNAGADIIETNSFNSNAFSLADYGLQDRVYELNRRAAELAKEAIKEYEEAQGVQGVQENQGVQRVQEVQENKGAQEGKKAKLVAGSLGPTSKTLSISADVNDPGAREITFKELYDTYKEQARGLIDGGADILLIETIFDTLNCKAAIKAIQDIENDIPVIISATISDASGRTLSGQTLEAFVASVAHAKPIAIGLNCGFGAKQLLPYIKRLEEASPYPISLHPNAGLPNVMGEYDESPETFADYAKQILSQQHISIYGGCCGTTPNHIKALKQAIESLENLENIESLEKLENLENLEKLGQLGSLGNLESLGHLAPLEPLASLPTTLSGLEPLNVSANTFISVGERTNVAGSAKFKKLIAAKDYEAALSVARQQVENGAQIIDVCMDDGLIDGVEAMTTFLRLIAAEPDIARVPVMIDSSRWDVIKAGLENVQGKSIVNSISLKEGEEKFLEKARHIMSMGAATVVMLFDENGQADSYERKMEVARRAYNLLKGIGFPTQDIIFDPNVLAVATGMAEHDDYARAFIAACATIRQEMPEVHLSGGISNLSFSFRGNNPVRQAMHSVFLYHAMKAGLDMSIVNPAMTTIYSDIPEDMLKAVEDVVLNTDSGAGERLMEFAQRLMEEKEAAANAAAGNGTTNGANGKAATGTPATLKERIANAMLKGITDNISDYAEEAYKESGSALSVIDNYLMPAMEKVGELFGEGKMFLPQVVKSARVMKKAVAVLEPHMENGTQQGGGQSHATCIFATVKGDVHDIGKNIAAVVTQCNGYNIIDLGVMVECDTIINSAIEHNADIIGLSGLITPSLDEMTKVVRELQSRYEAGLLPKKEGRVGAIPVIIGGATTSALHTAVKIAPEYPDGIVIRSASAAENAAIIQRLLAPDAAEYIAELKNQQRIIRENYIKQQAEDSTKKSRLNLAQARERRHIKKATEVAIPKPEALQPLDETVAISKVKEFINWNFFYQAWGLKGDARTSEEGQRLRADAEQMLREMEVQKTITLRAKAHILPAYSTEYDEIVISVAPEAEEPSKPSETSKPSKTSKFILPMPRSSKAADETLCLADYIMRRPSPSAAAHSAAAANSVADAVPDWICPFVVTAGIGLKELQEQYRSKNDEYRATMAKLLCDRLTEALAEYLEKRVGWGSSHIRFAFGYGACPDHALKRQVFDILGIDKDGRPTLDDGTPNTMPLALTDTNMIAPGESICGLLFANTPTKYFNVAP